MFWKHVEPQDQLQKRSAPNLLINAISVWDTFYLSEAIIVLKKKELLKHISPFGWEEISISYRFQTILKNKITLPFSYMNKKG
ncbi:hypothetical protein COK98_25965 [Bacillus cereus]|uniref:Tn3 transposase DDE domain-containing protein n=1 Tax=Bacillus cereus TaxID=1396 RepID=A0A9X7B798_BACCE|nr:hypothetical protein CON26_28530 [Bacillus cereus]PFV02837.1 hypothetical protein COK98_25965 [Bacillus cereus]